MTHTPQNVKNMFTQLIAAVVAEAAYQQKVAKWFYVPANPNDPLDVNYARRRVAHGTLF